MEKSKVGEAISPTFFYASIDTIFINCAVTLHCLTTNLLYDIIYVNA